MCVCVCVCVSGNACGYFISHPWEELHLYVMALSVYMYCRHKCFHTLFDLLKYGLMSKLQCNVLFPRGSLQPLPHTPAGAGRGHGSIVPPPPPTHTHTHTHSHTQTGNPGSITEIECTLLSGSAEQDALTMKESPLKNLIPFFLRPHPSWGWLQND